MPTNAQLGFNNSLYINIGTEENPIWVEIDLARDVTINNEKAEIDGTCRQTARDGYEASIDGLKKWSAEFESLIPAADETPNAAFSAIMAAFKANTTVDVLSVEGGFITEVGGTLPAERVTCRVYGGTKKQPNKDLSTISFKLVLANAAPVAGTAGDGEFTEGS